MKNIIMYYYEINNINLYKINNIYEFKYKNNDYYFKKLSITEEELNEILSLNFNNNNYNKLILNKEKKIITYYEKTPYVLIKKNTSYKNIENDILRIITIKPGKYNLDYSNWTTLWSKKIDYFEYQLNHVEKKYSIISESIDYYIGLAENAISYISNTYNTEIKEYSDVLCINHKRINNNNFYDPLNIVFDYKARDIGEYLKYLFFSKEYKNIDIKKFIKKLNFSKFSYRLLFGRMLYPSYYFDKYEKIINNNLNENDIISIINEKNNYEEYLKQIYNIINEITIIPKVDWI